MSATTLLSGSTTTDIVAPDPIELDLLAVLCELQGMRKNHDRMAQTFADLVAHVGQEARKAMILPAITTYCPVNCTTKFGPADNQLPVQLIETQIGERGFFVALLGDRTLLARQLTHREATFYALYDVKQQVKRVLDNEGALGIKRLARAAITLTDMRRSFVAES